MRRRDFGKVLAGAFAGLAVGQSGWPVVIEELILSSRGSATFRYVCICEDRGEDDPDPLVTWLDYGEAITVADGEAIT